MKVGESEREYVVAEALALAEIVPEGDAKLTYQEIAWAADQGDVPEDLSDKVGELVALAVETGRARSTHGPAGVRALLSVWRNTPQGQSAATQIEDLNEALTSLGGRTLDRVRVAPLGPGAYSLSIAAGDVEIRLTFDRTEATLRSINVGGGGTGE